MQGYITNVRGTRAFDRTTGKVVTLALALGTLIATTAPSHAQAPLKAKAVRIIREMGRPQDVTLDFVAADINDVLKALAVQTHTNIVSGTDVKGNVTVSLAHVSLGEALDMISHLSGFQYAKVGRSYVVGSPATIATMAAGGVTAALPSTAVLAVNYSDPVSLVTTIQDRYPGLKVSSGKAAGQGGRSVLIVSGLDTDVTAVKQLVADTEAGLSNGLAASQTSVYDIKYASADDLQTVLTRLVPNLIVTPGPAQRLAPVAPTTADAGGATSVTTSYGAVAPVATGGTVTAVTGNLPTKPTTSSLLLTGTEEDIARARQILAQVDLRPAQINFEAKVTDINLDKVRNLGINWTFGGTTSISEGNTYAGKILKFGVFSRSPLSNVANASLDVLFTDNNVRILADPNISALDGQPAATFVGDTITYVSSITTGPTGQNITTATVSAGIKLFVTGKVNNDGYITLNLHPEVSTVSFRPALGGSVLPDISTREATTTLRVKDGDTIAIGGLINSQDTTFVQKVPLLGDLPFFGQLFRDTQHDHTQREVVIFLKVAIAKDAS